MYHREEMLYRAVCLNVMLIIARMLAQHLPASTATRVLTAGCKCFPMRGRSGS